MNALRAGAAYFALVFGAGFVLGTVRVLLITPRISETSAVLVEAPLMLAISWIACAWVVRRFAVGREWTERLAMGTAGFALLMGAELALSLLVFGRTLAGHFAAYRTAAGANGLAAQFVFAIFPLILRHDRSE